jgi:hypothetical protein
VIKEKKGNSADINILLLSMLRSSGIPAVPVVLSTRENGYLNTAYPSISNFDYVVVQANINGKNIMLDATEKYLPAGFLPMRCLNGKGRIIDAANGGETDIVPAGDDNISEFQTLTIQSNGDISGSTAEKYSKYAAFNLRKKIEEDGGAENHIKKMTEKAQDFEMTDAQISDLDDISKNVSVKYNLSQKTENSNAGMIIFTPLKNTFFESNPFKSDERKYPIDYGCPITMLSVKQYTLPDGFEVSEMPAAASFSLPDGMGKFTFTTNITGNILQISGKFEIKKPLILSDNYGALKNFYDMVIAKQNEKVVLKKKA